MRTLCSPIFDERSVDLVPLEDLPAVNAQTSISTVSNTFSTSPPPSFENTISVMLAECIRPRGTLRAYSGLRGTRK